LGTTLLRQNDFTGFVVEVVKSQDLLLQCLCTSLDKVLSHLPPQCKSLFIAFQFKFWVGGIFNWAGIQCIDGYLDKTRMGCFCKSLC